MTPDWSDLFWSKVHPEALSGCWLWPRFATYGVFIVPQESAPFRYSGRPFFERMHGSKADKFHEQTAIELEPNCGIDTATYRADWKGVAPMCEVVTCDFDAARARRAERERGTATAPAQLGLAI